MEPPLAADEPGPSEPPSLKRRRASSSEDSGSDHGECEIFTKYFSSGCGKTKSKSLPKPETPALTNRPQASRKRKFVFKTDATVPKKCRRFYYLSESMTKPRKPKNTKSEAEEKSQGAPERRRKSHFARVDASGNLCLMHLSYLKSDLFFNDERRCSYEASKKQDLSFHIVDEIALEGLDGITLEAFWKRLKNVFPNYISKSVADRIWRLICNNKRISFYILTEPREKLISFDRCKYMDIDSGVFMEPLIEFNDIYPLASVYGTEVRGSCSTFKTRKENNGVRRFSMEKAIKLYDQRLVFVADQTLRNKALINEETDPNLELLDLEYCMLERIGRSREQGELTQGKMSLTSLSDNKSVYHNRKVLTQNFLIVNQFFYIKSFTLQQNLSGGLIHLSRFHNKRTTRQVVIMEQIANLLREKPNYQIELQEFRKIFGRSRHIIKLLKTAEFRRFFKIYTFPYRKVHPNASKQEYLSKSGIRERQIKILRMIDPLANVSAILESKDTKDVPQENYKSEGPGHKLMNYEYLRDIFLYILSSGTVGVTVQEIYDYFKMDFYSVRMAVRKLILRNVIDSSKIDLGRQQSLKFYAKCFNYPDSHVETTPKIYELDDETLAKALKGYDKVDSACYPEPKPPSEAVPPQNHFTLDLEPFCCTAFLTETVDSASDELTIYDIVIKGRDKLLLIQSNLFAHYISEWDDFLLKRDDFSKATQFFRSGFGKVIYDYLSTVRIGELKADNCIVFALENITSETRIGMKFYDFRTVEIDPNFCNPLSDASYVDSVSKIYLVEAMLNESHVASQTVDKLRNVFDRVMASEGKRKRDEGTPPHQIEPKIEVEVANNVVMEKFMGPNPVLRSSEVGEEGIKVDIFESTEPESYVEFGAVYTTADVSLTPRYISRANIILRIVYDQQIVKDVGTLFKDVRREEGEEGYDKKVCKKSVNSIILKLVTEGYIKILKIVMTGKNMTRTQSFVCLPHIDDTHVYIRSTIEQLKLKFYVGTVANQPKTIRVKKKIPSPFSISDVKDSIVELKQLTSTKGEPHYTFNRNIGKVYGYKPKFTRMRVLHEFLFYVIRELTSVEALSARQIFELCKRLKIKLTPNDVSAMPPVFCNEISWKMFIPALPAHNTFPKGWALACDIVLRMPLSVFVKICNVSYEIPELEAHLKHPIRRHYLLKNLPGGVQNVLFHKRKYFHSIYEVLCHLCYVGLLQLGPRNFKEKDQLFLFLNYRASLYDTCTSKPGYNQTEDKKYKKLTFEFKTGGDLEMYWSEMLRICINTPLGKRKVLDGQCVTIEDCNSKPAMVETLKAKTFFGAVEDDNGKIPGDRRGGAGFDSSLWTFIKRNWIWSGQLDAKASTSIQSEVTGLKKEKFDTALPQPIQYDLLAKGGIAERKVYLKPVTKAARKPNVHSIIVKKASRKKFIRKIVAPRTKRVREYYDAIDKAIMKKNLQLRVDWDEEEDQLLRYCRAASVFLCPVFKKQFIPYNIIRDVLHRLYPKSVDKTSKAVQRRMYLLLMSDEILKIMETNVENFLNSDTIAKYFDQIHNRYKYDIKITDSQMYISFIYLMSYIYKHRKEIELLLLGYIATVDFFSDSYIPLFEVIIQNIEDENVSASLYTDPKTVEDITKDTIKTVVHCSMACKKHNAGWTFQLAQIYKKFSDDLIRVTVAELKKAQFLLINKNYGEISGINNWQTPLKFSHLYNVAKSSTYTLAMYLETYRSLVELLKSGSVARTDFMAANELSSFWERVDFVFEIPEMGVILNPELEDHSEVIEELAKRFHLYLVKIHERVSGAKSRNKDELVPLEDKQESVEEVEKDIEEIKNDVRHLVFRVPYLLEGNLELYFKQMLESSINLEVNSYIYMMIIDLKKYAKENNSIEDLKGFIDGISEDINEDDQKKLMNNLSKVVFAIQTLQQQNVHENVSFEDKFKAWEAEQSEETISKSEESDSSRSRYNRNYSSAMENCIKRAQEGDFPSLDDIKEGMMAADEDTESRKIPHITDLIMLLTEGRFPELDTDNESIEKMKEHFIVQYPKLQNFIIEDIDELRSSPVIKNICNASKIDQIRKATENVVGQPQSDKLLKYVDDHDGNEDDVRFIKNLIGFIKSKKEFGASATELKRAFSNQRNLNLAELMEFLLDIGEVLRTGVTCIVYVHFEYQSEWLTETFMLSPKEKETFESKDKDEIKQLKSSIENKLKTMDCLKVQLKPWTLLDGSVNCELFQEWLCIILSHCIDFPTIPFLTLCEHFHYVKPVDVYRLCEVLQMLGCVDIYSYTKTENNLFTARCFVDDAHATCLDSFEDMFVKPTNTSGLSFGYYLDVEICL